MESATWLIRRTLGVDSEREAHSAVLELAGSADAALIAGRSAVGCVRRALEAGDSMSSLRSLVARQLDAGDYSKAGIVERAAFALCDAVAGAVKTAGVRGGATSAEARLTLHVFDGDGSQQLATKGLECVACAF